MRYLFGLCQSSLPCRCVGTTFRAVAGMETTAGMTTSAPSTSRPRKVVLGRRSTGGQLQGREGGEGEGGRGRGEEERWEEEEEEEKVGEEEEEKGGRKRRGLMDQVDMSLW